jgi:hypothetical protein
MLLLADAAILPMYVYRVKEASTGYFEDYNKLRHEGGKLWVAPKTLIQEKVGYWTPGRNAFSGLYLTSLHVAFPSLHRPLYTSLN